MRKIVVSVTVAAAAVLATSYARAADLPMAPAYAAPAPPIPVYTWTGIYFGANAGYAFGQSTPMSLYSSDFSAFNFSTNGWLGGLTAGAQIQNGHTVIGVEADIDWTNINGSSTGAVKFNGAPIGNATLSSSLSSISTLVTRIGYAYENWLFYGAGGIALTNETSTLSGPIGFACGTGAFNSPPCSSPTTLHFGLAARAGFDLNTARRT